MAADKGRDFVLKVGDGATSEAFNTVGGMRTTGIAFSGQAVNVSDKDSAGWQELLAAAGETKVTISAQGVFKGTTYEGTMRTNFLAQSIDNYEIHFGDGHKFAGAFQITAFEYTGENNGARMYSLTLESSGVISYT